MRRKRPSSQVHLVALGTLVFVAACAVASAFVPTGNGNGNRQRNQPELQTQSTMMVAGLETRTLDVGGTSRTYHLHVPPTVTPGVPAPLVLAFHGGGGDAVTFASRSGLIEMADREGFIIAFPEGTRNSWNTEGSPAVGFASRNDIDDLGFVTAMLDQLVRDYSINTARVFATGISAGAMMTYRLACDMPDRLAAVAVVAGTLADTSCAGLTGVSLLHIHGSNDQNVPLEGGAGSMSAARADYPPVMQGIDLFRARNQCTAPDISSAPASDTVCLTTSCGNGTTVEFCEVTPGGHAWPGTDPARWQESNGVYVSPYFSATDHIGAFFRTH